MQPCSASRSSSSTIEPPVAISSSSTIARLPATSPTIASMTTRSSASRCLLPAATGRPSSRANWVAVLALPRSGETTTVLARSWSRKWSASTPMRGEVVDRDREEAVHLRRVQRHRQHPVGAGRGEHVGDQPAADRDPRGVLLVRAGVRVVRDDGGDLRRGGAARGVEHQQQLHQVLLRRRHQRLDDVDVALAAVLLELHLEAVVAEPADVDRRTAGHPRRRRCRRRAVGGRSRRTPRSRACEQVSSPHRREAARVAACRRASAPAL